MVKTDLIDKGLQKHNIDITYNEDELEIFQQMLLDWNQKTDLTGITDPDEIAIKHFLDSFTPFKFDQFKNKATMVDVGTGAGFPAIPMKLVNKDLDITLLDSLNKRLIFLDEVIDQMVLQDIRTLHIRGEEAGQSDQYREHFDLGVSRAVARLNILLELSLPLIKVGGYFLAMKGRDGLIELDEAKDAIKILGAEVIKVEEMNLWDGENERVLILLQKTKNTPKSYPRNFGQIKKRPL